MAGFDDSLQECPDDPNRIHRCRQHGAADAPQPSRRGTRGVRTTCPPARRHYREKRLRNPSTLRVARSRSPWSDSCNGQPEKLENEIRPRAAGNRARPVRRVRTDVTCGTASRCGVKGGDAVRCIRFRLPWNPDRNVDGCGHHRRTERAIRTSLAYRNGIEIRASRAFASLPAARAIPAGPAAPAPSMPTGPAPVRRRAARLVEAFPVPGTADDEAGRLPAANAHTVRSKQRCDGEHPCRKRW